jgi:hypothetical protein
MDTSLVKQELIELLCVRRVTFISLMVQQVELIKQTHQLCKEMDDMIPSHPNANYDYLDIVFFQFKEVMGETLRSRIPKDVNILEMGTQSTTELFTKILDENLWLIIFNRLNVFSLMSAGARKVFKAQLKETPLAFTPENIANTLSDLLGRQDELLLDGLIESIQANNQGYVCNDKFRFNSKVIFKDATFMYGRFVKLRDSGGFKDVITFLSKVVFGRQSISSADSSVKDTVLWEQMNDYFIEEQLETLYGDVVEFEGGKVTFYNNGNAHLILSPAMVSFLNQQLSKSNALKHAA